MKLLIIGKNGQVGASLVSVAKKQSIDFIATDRQTLNIVDKTAIDNYFEIKHDFDFVINAAAYTQVDHAENDTDNAYAVNCFAVGYLADACKKYHIPLIHISTDYVFDGKKNTGYCETDIPNPQNIYGKTKYDGENILKSTWEKHIILRVSWVFSEWGKNFVKSIINLCDQKDVFSVVCDQYGSPTSARSIASVIIHICKQIKLNNANDLWGIYHYSDFPATNWHQLACYIAQLKENNCGVKKEVIAIETKDYPTPVMRPKNSILINTKLKNTFGITQNCWMPEVERIFNVASACCG